ncbi:MAG: universal stress protein [Spongiibacteraceae bacterium]
MDTIVVIADKLGGKNIALARALSLQKETGADIALLGFCYTNLNNLDDSDLASNGPEDLKASLIEHRQQQLNELIKSSASPHTVTTTALWGKDISSDIINYCKHHPVSMVIKSANRSETFLYTPTDWQLLRECPAPVLITAQKSWKKKAHILAALDFSTTDKSKMQLNHKIMAHAQSLASALDNVVHIAFSLSIPQPLVDMDIIDSRTHAQKKRKRLQPTIDAFCQQYGISKEQLHIKQGPADKVIASIAKALKADLVVTGTVGRKGIKGKIMGNTAEGILSHIRTDILAIKPD